MTNYKKIAKYIIAHYNEGEILSHQRIVNEVHEECGINKTSILPADYCDNNTGVDPHVGKYHIFHKLGDGRYSVLNHEKIKKSCGLGQ